MTHRDDLDSDERVVLLNAMEEGLVSELQHECHGDARAAFTRLWRAGLVSLNPVGAVDEYTEDDVAAVIENTRLWDGSDPSGTRFCLVATDLGLAVFQGLRGRITADQHRVLRDDRQRGAGGRVMMWAPAGQCRRCRMGARRRCRCRGGGSCDRTAR